MGKQAVRFGVHDGAGHRAATWKLLTGSGRRSEIYLTCRELAGTLKASLHASGQWHFAYPQHFFEEHVKGTIPKFEDRYLEKWLRPSNFARGTTLAVRIVTPWSAVTTPVQESRFRKVTWLPSAPESMATEVDILITEPKTHISGWPGKQSMGTSCVGSLPLANGQTVWAVYWFINMPDVSTRSEGTGWFFKGKSEKDLKEGNIRCLVFGTEPDGSRAIYDCAVQVNPIP